MDDPLFIWSAQHIRTELLNPFRFDVNWYGKMEPMTTVTKNPPLACYYIAAAGSSLGWSEVALHAAFLLPVLAAVLGTYRLAQRWCRNPLLAALMFSFTPVFLVSSSTVMCDTLMLGFWVWAVVFWVEAAESKSIAKYLLAGLLALCAGLTKYFGIALVPLLAAYSLMKQRSIGRWAVGLLPAVIGIAAWDFACQHLYGRSVLFDAATYAGHSSDVAASLGAKLQSVLIAIDFTGGSLAMCAFVAFTVIPRRTVLWVAAGTIIFAVLLFTAGGFLRDYGPIEGSTRWLLKAQVVFWAVGGAAILAVTGLELRERRDAETWLSGLWILGTLVFTALFNWTVNGRSILPMGPPVAILLARKIEGLLSRRRPDATGSVSRVGLSGWALAGAMTAGGLLGVSVLRADFLFAQTARASALQASLKYSTRQNLLWFQGHWGFQYYMQQRGARAVDEGHSALQPGDIVAVPVNNGDYTPFRPDLVVLREMMPVNGPQPRCLTTMKGEVGAGFYAAERGPLPFSWGLVPEEKVAILLLEPHQNP
jgi:4-amino-4-deoxy-L-arabinose transferase-like glycosyltransferase